MLSGLRRSASRLNINDLLDQCIEESKEDLFKLIRSQLNQGKASYRDLPELKSLKYKKQKIALNPEADGRVDLKLTGSFQSKFKLRFSKYSFIVRSSDKKAVLLMRKYGTDTMGLSNENMDYYINSIILPLLRKKIKNGM